MDRKTALADAAITLVGGTGLRALTHRAVDATAGLPPGTCSYHYRTRRALLAAALTRIADLDTAVFERARNAPDRETLLVELLTEFLAPNARDRTRARLVMVLDPEARREAGDIADALAGRFVAVAAEMTGDPATGRLAIAMFDGLLADDLIRGADPATVRQRAAMIAALFPS